MPGSFTKVWKGFVFNEKENRCECIKEGGHKAFLPFKRILITLNVPVFFVA